MAFEKLLRYLEKGAGKAHTKKIKETVCKTHDVFPKALEEETMILVMTQYTNV